MIGAFPDDIESLQLLIPAIVEGYFAGQHQSLFRGAGTELAWLRAYQPGDELRRVDWIRFAATQKLLVRESELETSTRVVLVPDRTASMNITYEEGDRWAYTRLLVACLAYIADKQGDEVVLWLDEMEQYKGYESILQALLTSKADAQVLSFESLLHRAQKQKEHLILITDGWDELDELLQFLQEERMRSSIQLVQVIFERELNPFGTTGTQFYDPESGETIQSTPNQQAHYIELVRAHREALAEAALERELRYACCYVNQPIELGLEAVLEVR